MKPDLSLFQHLSAGERCRGEGCVRGKTRSDCALVVRRCESGRLAYKCFSATCPVRSGGSGFNLAYLLKPKVARELTQPTLPDGFIRVVPEDWQLWLTGKGISAESMERYDFGYSTHLRRLVVPLYGKSLEGWVARSNTHKPKWLAMPNMRSDVMFFGRLDKTVYLVEDVFSAIRFAQLGVGSIAMLTAGVNKHQAKRLKSAGIQEAVIAFDADATQAALSCVALLTKEGIKTKIKRMFEDPKDMTDQQLKIILEG